MNLVIFMKCLNHYFFQSLSLFTETGEKKNIGKLEEGKEILLKFGSKNSSQNSTSSHCVFWNFDKSEWSKEGCLTFVENLQVICKCGHLTNFAVLVKNFNLYLLTEIKSVLNQV